MNAEGSPITISMLLCLVIVIIFSTMFALSGVGKCIKWLSNINMGLSFFILASLLIFGSTMFALSSLFTGIWDYIINLPMMSMTVWKGDGVEDSVATELAGWQGGWTIFYWA